MEDEGHKTATRGITMKLCCLCLTPGPSCGQQNNQINNQKYMENNQVILNIIALAPVSETSQELRMMSRSLSECQSLTLKVMI